MRPQDHHNILSSQSPIFYLPLSQTLPLTSVPWAPSLLIVDPLCALTIGRESCLLATHPSENAREGMNEKGEGNADKEWYKLKKVGEAEWEESNGLVWTERENVNKRPTAMGFTISFKLQTTITVIWRSETHIMSKFKKQTWVHNLNKQPQTRLE